MNSLKVSRQFSQPDALDLSTTALPGLSMSASLTLNATLFVSDMCIGAEIEVMMCSSWNKLKSEAVDAIESRVARRDRWMGIS
jgi:hypothetical protein